MVTAVIMPKAGNTVESAIVVAWRKEVGDSVSAGDSLVDIETDKSTIEVECPVSGTLLARFFNEGDEVPVMVNIAAIGDPGESVESLRPASAAETPTSAAGERSAASQPMEVLSALAQVAGEGGNHKKISPRARKLAASKQLTLTDLTGTGPGGRIIERDVIAALESQPHLTPVARLMVEQGAFIAPERGSGPGGRVTKKDLIPASTPEHDSRSAAKAEESETVQIKGVRKVIAQRMLESMQTTAQLTLDTSADARAILAYRKKLKASDESLGLQKITVGDLVNYAVARTLPDFPNLNALFQGDSITQYRTAHVGFAVDTPRGLMVPVIRHADRLSLKQIADEAHHLADACLDGSIQPDDMAGATFTVTNLGSFGIESFTPILNPPQVGILGVSNINLKPVALDGDVTFVPHLGLSLTINHQVVDGAPGARFLQALSRRLAEIDLLIAT